MSGSSTQVIPISLLTRSRSPLLAFICLPGGGNVLCGAGLPGSVIIGSKPAVMIDAITSSPGKSFTLVELARLCNSIVFQLSRSCTGCAPFEFQRQLRVQKAKALLHGTDLSIEQISMAVGSQSPTSFSRLFRKVIGQSPSGFRHGGPPHHNPVRK